MIDENTVREETARAWVEREAENLNWWLAHWDDIEIPMYDHLTGQLAELLHHAYTQPSLSHPSVRSIATEVVETAIQMEIEERA